MAAPSETIAPSMRRAAPEDAPAIAAILDQGIEEGASTFDTAPVAPADVVTWIARAHEPALVAVCGGRVAGFARTIASAERCAFAGIGEYAIYLDRGARGRGIGTRLLGALVRESEAGGYFKLQGRLFATNHASIALARRCGFREVGVYERHGRLHGVWRDLVVVERLLGEALHD